MDFDTLHTLIPHALGEKLHVLEMHPYNGVTLAMPGRHQKDTPVPGGDFVVMVDETTLGWVKHQFTHDDIFKDIEKKTQADPAKAQELMVAYAKVVMGADPEDFRIPRFDRRSLSPTTFLFATQCLAVAEHRRYGRHEARGGGRFLPARFASGIVEGKWTAADAKVVQRRGRPGLEQLEKEKGKPTRLKELAA